LLSILKNNSKEFLTKSASKEQAYLTALLWNLWLSSFLKLLVSLPKTKHMFKKPTMTTYKEERCDQV
jgi:hypothetical protein